MVLQRKRWEEPLKSIAYAHRPQNLFKIWTFKSPWRSAGCEGDCSRSGRARMRNFLRFACATEKQDARTIVDYLLELSLFLSLTQSCNEWWDELGCTSQSGQSTIAKPIWPMVLRNECHEHHVLHVLGSYRLAHRPQWLGSYDLSFSQSRVPNQETPLSHPSTQMYRR